MMIHYFYVISAGNLRHSRIYNKRTSLSRSNPLERHLIVCFKLSVTFSTKEVQGVSATNVLHLSPRNCEES